MMKENKILLIIMASCMGAVISLACYQIYHYKTTICGFVKDWQGSVPSSRKRETLNVQPLARSAKKPSIKLISSQEHKEVRSFDALCKKVNIPALSQSILSGDEEGIKSSLDGMANLNGTIAAQIEAAVTCWHTYLDSVQKESPTQENYLLGKVMSALLGTMKSLFVQSSIDQAMLLSLVRKILDKSVDSGLDHVTEQQWQDLYQ